MTIVSTSVETNQPKQEIQPALTLHGPILEIFASVSVLHDLLEDGKANNLWITKSYDPSSHFEIVSKDILDINQRLTGEKLDLNIEAENEGTN